jgi:hypothetical protein
MAVYRERSDAHLDRVYADAWCETYFAQIQACPSGLWLIAVCRKDTGEDVINDLETTSPGFMGAYRALMEILQEKGIMGSFEVVE